MSRGCLVCGGGDLSAMLSIASAPVLCNQLCQSKADAEAAKTAPIELCFCRGCGHVFNQAYDDNLLRYSPEYENSLHFSPRFQAFAENLAEELRARHELSGKNVIEIGCGSGDFLKSLCDRDSTKGYGFDPSYRGNEQATAHVRISRRSYFDVNDAPVPDLLCCRHVIEHIEHPVDFIKAIVDKVHANRAAAIYFEVPNGLFTLRGGGIWDIIYEHPSYFTPQSFCTLADAVGLSEVDIQETFEGQFLSMHARAAQGIGSAAPATDLAAVSVLADGFAREYSDKVEQWEQTLAALGKSGKKVVVWGAGSKGNTFLNVLAGCRHVEHVVDINPRKHGKYVAGTAQCIVGPEAMGGYQPDTVIVMNPVYVEEIGRMLHDLGLSPEILTA